MTSRRRDPGTELDRDFWCVNCKQAVRPKVGMPPEPFLATILLGGGLVALLRWLGIGASGNIELVLFLVVGAVVFWRLFRWKRTCPICKTDRLRELDAGVQ